MMSPLGFRLSRGGCTLFPPAMDSVSIRAKNTENTKERKDIGTLKPSSLGPTQRDGASSHAQHDTHLRTKARNEHVSPQDHPRRPL